MKLLLNMMRAILSTLAMSASVLGTLAARETIQRPNLSCGKNNKFVVLFVQIYIDMTG